MMPVHDGRSCTTANGETHTPCCACTDYESAENLELQEELHSFFQKHCKNATALKERGANSNVPSPADSSGQQAPAKQGVQQASTPSSKQQKKKRRQQKAKTAQSAPTSPSPERTPVAGADSVTDRASQSSAAQDHSTQPPASHSPAAPSSASASTTSTPVVDERSSEQQQAESAKDLGNSQYKAGQYDAALMSYGKAIELCPAVAAYYGNRAAAALMKRQYKLAVQDCLQATKLNSSFARGYQRAGEIPSNSLQRMIRITGIFVHEHTV